ncbi:MAG: 50S ribosomal protein L18 [Methylocystaceae bacterium]
MIKKTSRNELRKVKHTRLRRKVVGTPERPRLCMYRSLSHIYAQVIDDISGHTLVSASTLEPELRDLSSRTNTDAARQIGTLVGKRAVDKGISEVVFDRGGYQYHGRVAALADAARESGLKF